eukprot:6071083-Amphidinium_carterae.1
MMLLDGHACDTSLRCLHALAICWITSELRVTSQLGLHHDTGNPISKVGAVMINEASRKSWRENCS